MSQSSPTVPMPGRAPKTTSGRFTHRERVLAALAHRPADRVPLDLASTRVTSITVPLYRELQRAFGVDEPVQVIDRMQQVVAVNERILQALDIDTRGVWLGPPDGSRDVELDAETYRDEWGVVRRKPPTSFYYDLVESPLTGEIGLSDIVRYPWPRADDPGRFRGLRERVLALRASTDCAIVMNVTTGFVHTSQYLRGFEDWYCDLLVQPDLFGALLDAIVDVNMEITSRALDLVGDLVDLVFTGDDLGHEHAPMVSPEMYRRLIKPRQARFFGAIHARTAAPLLYHTCGSVHALLPDLIEIGVNALNPVQVTASHMAPARLKAEFGDRLTFWGAVDTRQVLPRGTPDDVRREVAQRIAELAPGGGYVLTAVHNVQPDVPLPNLLAMYEAARAAPLPGDGAA